LDLVLPGLVSANCELGAGQSWCYLPGRECCSDCGCGSSQGGWCWGYSLSHCHGLEQAIYWVAYCLCELYELHCYLCSLLTEVVCKERSNASCTCIDLNLYVTLDLDAFEGLNIHL